MLMTAPLSCPGGWYSAQTHNLFSFASMWLYFPNPCKSFASLWSVRGISHRKPTQVLRELSNSMSVTTAMSSRDWAIKKNPSFEQKSGNHLFHSNLSRMKPQTHIPSWISDVNKNPIPEERQVILPRPWVNNVMANACSGNCILSFKLPHLSMLCSHLDNKLLLAGWRKMFLFPYLFFLFTLSIS